MHPNVATIDDSSSRKGSDEALLAVSIQMDTIAISDSDAPQRGGLPLGSEAEEEALLNQPTASTETTVKESLETASSAPPTKVLFLDGVRGLAAMLVYLQHSHDYSKGLHPGEIGVDIFFVLSSFLLTWLFMKTSIKLLAQGASLRTWKYVLADYFQKRFLRVYPLFFVTVMILALMTPKDQKFYFTSKRPPLDIFKTLVFDFDYRYHVFWSLPLEIAYYFVIPVFVLIVLGMRRMWLVGALPLTVWVVYEGFCTIRKHHSPLRPHISTFLTGSLAALVFVKLDLWMKKAEFAFRWWHTAFVRAVEGLTIAVLLSVSFRGLLFDWIHANPTPATRGAPYTSGLVSVLIVIEMVQPSWVSAAFEWNVLRYWGKIGFSIYLMHPFVVENTRSNNEPYYYNRLFSRLVLITIVATVTYYLVEYPSSLLAQRISKYLKARGSNASAC
ncbi:unnamed protein product [Hyaloperonospora brassicae]|uniref:Acyltransferase 3 domain-containing protein n=1 Tax=Hyaloperonospora brassicae TaxID=162125 RepID=A0AAV0V2D3_HYABA|nr:unnamed protein product [Hyaloperonospora brassicae]